MPQDEITEDIVRRFVSDCAFEIADQVTDCDRISELAHEFAAGSEYAIYYYKARRFCGAINIDSGLEYFDDLGDAKPTSFNEICTTITAAELAVRIDRRAAEIYDANAPEYVADAKALGFEKVSAGEWLWTAPDGEQFSHETAKDVIEFHSYDTEFLGGKYTGGQA